MDEANRQGSGADSDSVRVELQADCYAGMWAGAAASTVDPDTGVTYLEPITQAQLQNALAAAAAVGDDNIQEQSGGEREPRVVDARLQRAARALVHHRLRAGHPRGLRHVRHRPALTGRHAQRATAVVVPGATTVRPASTTRT